MDINEEIKLDKLMTRFKRNITALNKTIAEVRKVHPESYLFFSGDSGGGVVSACIMDNYSENHDRDEEQEIDSAEVRNASCGAF
tara:strand:+ start:183 stop:434 length:252 start_codon:yes stop_codon:yes gene_type:complete